MGVTVKLLPHAFMACLLLLPSHMGEWPYCAASPCHAPQPHLVFPSPAFPPSCPTYLDSSMPHAGPAVHCQPAFPLAVLVLSYSLILPFLSGRRRKRKEEGAPACLVGHFPTCTHIDSQNIPTIPFGHTCSIKFTCHSHTLHTHLILFYSYIFVYSVHPILCVVHCCDLCYVLCAVFSSLFDLTCVPPP